MRAVLWTIVCLAVAAGLADCGKSQTGPRVEETKPPAPVWAHVAVTAANAITLQWSDVAQGEAGYQVERSLAANSGFASIATPPTDAQEYVDTSVAPGVRYYYRILTRDSLGRLSDPTPVIWADALANSAPTLPANPDPPNKGFNLDLPGYVTLAWEVLDPDGPAPSSTVYFGEARNALAAVGTSLTANRYTLTDTLQLTRFYFWRVVAVDDHGATAVSPIWSFGTRMERLSVPAGYFARGDCGLFSPAEPERFCPAVRAESTRTFNMDKYEVSNALFAQFLNELLDERWVQVRDGRVTSKVGDTLFAAVYPAGDEHSGIEFIPYGGGAGLFLPRPGRENFPVMEVSWHGAARFAGHFGRRLPTEAEWEKAARGTSPEHGWLPYEIEGRSDSVGVGFPFPWGDSDDSHYCNYLGSGDPYEARVGVATTPVGYYDGKTHGGYSTLSNRSPYAIYDLAGNVAEWCADDFVPYHGGPSGTMKSIRGGGWRSRLSSCQTFWREGMSPDSTDNLVGFRTVASE